jgi:hypothetical protein
VSVRRSPIRVWSCGTKRAGSSAKTTTGAPQPGAAEVRQAAAAVGAFALTEGSKDAARLLTVTPGNYTVVVTGAPATTGIALVEAYEVP